METPQPQPKRKVFKRIPTIAPIAQSGFKGDFTPEIVPVAFVVPVSPKVVIEVPSVPILTADQELEIYKKVQSELTKKKREEATNKRTPEEQEAYLKKKREENAKYRASNKDKIKKKTENTKRKIEKLF